MIDETFKLYLIEVNTNPCLETTCPLLTRIISEMLDNSFRIAIDPLFTAQSLPGVNEINGVKKVNNVNSNDFTLPIVKYSLVFDEKIEG
jgi:tubulin monoglycylase TTLL3/8